MPCIGRSPSAQRLCGRRPLTNSAFSWKCLGGDDFVQAVDKDVNNLLRQSAQPLPDPFHRQRPHLADLHPRFLRQPEILGQLEREGIRRPLLLARDRHRDHSARSLVEDVLAQHDHGPQASLLMPSNRVQIGPDNFSPQYSGHSEASPAKPSSASLCSNCLSSFAASRATRDRSSLSSFSCTASWIARLRLGNRLSATSRSSLRRSSRSMLIATLADAILPSSMTSYHTSTEGATREKGHRRPTASRF